MATYKIHELAHTSRTINLPQVNTVIKFPCCLDMQFMIEKFLIQWKQKYGFDSEGWYFCCNDAANAAQDCHTNTRKGKPFFSCPYCKADLPRKPKMYQLRRGNKSYLEV